MKAHTHLILAVSLGLLGSCKKDASEAETKKETASEKADDLTKADMPILPVKKGDYWKYQVFVEIPAGITSPGSSAVETHHEKVRTYIGKISPGPDMAEVDAFDVVAPRRPMERELVEISDKAILMRGSAEPEVSDSKPIWLDPPVPFVFAGMRAGNTMADLSIAEGASNRGLKVVAREEVTVPLGKFEAIRLLLTGNDGQLELRKTTWFVPKLGIVKEEMARYARGKLIFRETTELLETSVELD